jgi:hypothetical protein
MLRSGGVDKSTVQSEEVWTGKLLSLGPLCNFMTVLGIRIRRIRMFLGLKDPDTLVRGRIRIPPFSHKGVERIEIILLSQKILAQN